MGVYEYKLIYWYRHGHRYTDMDIDIVIDIGICIVERHKATFSCTVPDNDTATRWTCVKKLYLMFSGTAFLSGYSNQQWSAPEFITNVRKLKENR